MPFPEPTWDYPHAKMWPAVLLLSTCRSCKCLRKHYWSDSAVMWHIKTWRAFPMVLYWFSFLFCLFVFFFLRPVTHALAHAYLFYITRVELASLVNEVRIPKLITYIVPSITSCGFRRLRAFLDIYLNRLPCPTFCLQVPKLFWQSHSCKYIKIFCGL